MNVGKLGTFVSGIKQRVRYFGPVQACRLVAYNMRQDGYSGIFSRISDCFEPISLKRAFYKLLKKADVLEK